MDSALLGYVIDSVLPADAPRRAQPPFQPYDEARVLRDIEEASQHLASVLRAELRSEDSYGSGYASYVDAWFYRDEPAFRVSDDRHHHRGLVVLFCKLAPVYCFLEGEKAWDGRSGSSYLPSFEGVDLIESESVRALAEQAERTLAARDLVRVHRSALEEPLLASEEVPTILADPPFRYFDVLFHWED